MKRLTIEQQERRLSNSEAKIFKKVLDSLGIQFTIDVVEETPIDLRIIDLKDRITVRAYNVICNFVDPAMTINEFVENYTIVDLLKRRNFGHKSAKDIRSTLKGLGYVW